MKIILVGLGRYVSLFGLRILSSLLKSKGHEPSLCFIPIDSRLALYKNEQRAFVQFIKEQKPDLIGFSLMFCDYLRARRLTRALKSEWDIPVIWGGLHPTVSPESTPDEVDFICSGEGENAVVELLRRLSHGSRTNDVPGILQRGNGWSTGAFQKADRIADLNALPFPDYAIDRHHVLLDGKIKALNAVLMQRCLPHLALTHPILTSRGCPYNCDYCANSSLISVSQGPYIRRLKPERVVAEMDSVLNAYPYLLGFMMADDLFVSAPDEWIEEFCSLYSTRIRLPFYCEVHPNHISEKTMKLLQNSGLTGGITMAHAYTPGLKVSAKIKLSKKRILPLKGQVLVKIGDPVKSETVIARTELPGKVIPINAANILGVPPGDLPRYVFKKDGDLLQKDEVYAIAKSFFGLFKTTLKAPEECSLESVSAITGKILLRGNPLPVEVRAYVDGWVTEVYPNEGVGVECWASFAQGIFGIGGETNGIIKMVCKTPDEPLTPEKISADHQGCVIVGGSIVTAAALKKAIDNKVKGIVVGGFDDQDLRNFLGYDLGVAITGSENKGITLVITEGFGEIPMALRTFELMKSHEGRKACINGATQIRAGVIRPEVVVPMQEKDLVEGEKVAAGSLQFGTPIRVIREPYFGRIGTVSELPTEPARLESETKARILKVRFSDNQDAIVPRANVEILET